MREMKEDMRKREAEGKGGEVYLLPQRDLLKLKTPGPEDQGQKGSPSENPDPLEKISQPSGCPDLEELLRSSRMCSLRTLQQRPPLRGRSPCGSPSNQGAPHHTRLLTECPQGRMPPSDRPSSTWKSTG